MILKLGDNLTCVMGRGVCCWSQSQLSPGEGREHPGLVASSSQGPEEQFGVQYLAQRHFDMQLSSARGSQDFSVTLMRGGHFLRIQSQMKKI